ncbi:MAG: hypothetical protein KBA91_01975 [Candidatus Moranbacteria bacterium]|nr:hypothetical protein [Candidatus Moranbacteria bacterium]
MQDKQPREKGKPLPELRSSVTEILVANGRAFQPFIRTFSYTGENITKQNLGTLIGVFEIDDQSEDSAYIVNFLASVAKKEYFNNPRRGAIESFEAALHKINLALAELVKHGNVTWLGKFHGALGVLEKNNLHFSVSGHATILLLRNDTIADISEGLSSDESHVHPIKTFVEVSSGRLAEHDQILLSSPELLALFSLEELNKHAGRMGSERFTQFLKTALVNELDMAGLMAIDVFESPLTTEESPSEKKERHAPPVRTKNVFSQSAFTAKTPAEAISVKEVLVAKQEEKEAEYTDNKTGHIYVQGDTPSAQSQHPFFSELSLRFQEIPHMLSAASALLGKRLRKVKKTLGLATRTVSEESQALAKKITRALRRRVRQYRLVQEAKQKERAAQTVLPPMESVAPEVIIPAPTVSDIPRPLSPPVEATRVLEELEPTPHQEESVAPTEHAPEVDVPPFLKSKLAQFYQKQRISPSKPVATSHHTQVSHRNETFWQTCTTHYQMILRWSIARLSRWSLPRFNKKQFLAGMAVIVLSGTVIAWFIFRSQRAPSGNEVASNQIVDRPTNTDTSRPNAANEATTLLSNTPDIIGSVQLGSEVYVVTKKRVIAPNTNTSFTLPNGAKARYATAMDDLRLIFIMTDSGTVYAFSPISKTFIENALPLENNANVVGIDTYLTYLYVLDSNHNQVYRFPRAEGGFGTGTTWLKDSLTFDDSAHLAVNETLFIAPDASSVRGFFRGRSSSTFELPSEGLHVTDLYTHPGLQNVYALDNEHACILIWNQDGKLIDTITHENLSQGRTLSVNEKSNEVFVSTENALLSFKLK